MKPRTHEEKTWLLIEKLLPLSRASDWSSAKVEWKIEYVFDVDEPTTCLCSHYPIKEVYVIQNNVTGVEVEIGNVCIKKIFASEARVAHGLKKIREDSNKSTTPELIIRAHNDGIINDWEREFYENTQRKQFRGMTRKQREKRLQINMKIYAWYNKQRGVA